MDREALARDFGASLVFHGAVDNQRTLPFGTPEEVRRKTRENLEDTGGIGHIFGASIAVMAQTPPENYLAMLDEADRFRP
jgi:uroporphyrinogen decarboxylase